MLKISRIVVFALVLFVLQVATGTIMTLLFGVPNSGNEILAGSIAGVVISVCVFAYMSWAYPTKPYMNAFAVSLSVLLFGALAMTLLLGGLSWWQPATFIFDTSELLVSIVLGTSVGSSLRKRHLANS